MCMLYAGSIGTCQLNRHDYARSLFFDGGAEERGPRWDWEGRLGRRLSGIPD